jgi:hypothetical protein
MKYSREPIQIGFNRRLMSQDQIVMAPNPHGVVLPWVDVLSVESTRSERIAVLFGHAAHPVIVHATSTLITADYPGFAVQTLRRVHAARGVFLFAQGCCGNINAFPLRGGIEAAAAAGRELGQAVSRALAGERELVRSGPLKVARVELELPLQAPPPVAAIRRMLETEKNPERRARRQELLKIAESGESRTIRYPIRAFGIGDQLCLLGLSHEPFAEYQMYVERTSPFEHNVIFAYTNGLECYVGTKDDYLLGDRGGYETSPRGAALMFESRLPLAPEAERRIHDGITRLLRELKST